MGQGCPFLNLNDVLVVPRTSKRLASARCTRSYLEVLGKIVDDGDLLSVCARPGYGVQVRVS